MSDDHDDADRPDYDPRDVELPSKEPPLRSTAPQTAFTLSQAGVGLGVLGLGLVLTFGLGVAAA